jgi:hypothetical protein
MINNDEKSIIIDTFSSVWSMLKLNTINYQDKETNEIITLNLVAIGFSDGKIFLVNLSTFKIHQILKTINSIYSLAQYKNNPNYLLCSLSNGYIIVYKLVHNNYKEIQKLQKPNNFNKDSINKIIILSNEDIVSAEKRCISIWRQKKDQNGSKIEEFEFIEEIYTDFDDICHLVEVKNNLFACAIYSSKVIKVFKNDENTYNLSGTVRKIESHGNNSNGLARINDKYFCCGGKNYFIYIIGVEPVELIQRIKLVNEESASNLSFMHSTDDGLFIFTSYYENIIQLKIITDINNNFIELEECSKIVGKKMGSNAIITTNEGKIFYQKNLDKTTFCLISFKS